MQPKVYIIVLNYFSWEDTIECLESLLKLDYENFQIIVVDNASPNNSLDFLKEWTKGNLCLYLPNDNPLKKHSFPLTSKPIAYEHYHSHKVIDANYTNNLNKIIFIESPVNGGYSAGNNLGIEYALSKKDTDFLWILNNDTTLQSDSLSQLTECFQKETKAGNKIGILGGKLLYYHTPDIIQNIGAYYIPSIAYSKLTAGGCTDAPKWNTEKVKINHIVGASLFLPVSFVLDVGNLSEDYFLYMEEVDWAIRARKKGWEIKYCSKANIYHKEGVTINQGIVSAITNTKSLLSEYYWARNKILLTKKFYPYFLPLVILTSILAILRKISKGPSRRIFILLTAIFHGFTGDKIRTEKLRK